MKMKGMVIIGSMILVSLSACDAVNDGITELQKSTEKGWEYSTKVDKLTQVHSASATREFTDKDVDFVRVDMEVTCKNSKELTGKITTYDTRPDKDGNLSGATMSYDFNELNFIETRSGKNSIGFIVNLPNFSNELIFDVVSPDLAIRLLIPQIYQDSATKLMLSQMNMSGKHITKESASLMVDNQWIIRVNTELGNPTITVDLNDPSVKKVTDQCNWHPAFSNSNSAVSTDSSTATNKTNKNTAGKDGIQTKATFLGYAEMDRGCTSNFIINGKKVDVEGCPKDKMIYENNKGKALTLTYKTGMVKGVEKYYFVDVQE